MRRARWRWGRWRWRPPAAMRCRNAPTQSGNTPSHAGHAFVLRRQPERSRDIDDPERLSMNKIAVAALALAGGLAALAPAASIAQSRQAPPAAEEARGHAPGMRMRERLSPEQRIERRAERLRATLQLQPGQE